LERHRRHGYTIEHNVDLLRVTFCTSGHERGYLHDFGSLSVELARTGFLDIRRCEAGSSQAPCFRRRAAD
jgi:hypothetical protein